MDTDLFDIIRTRRGWTDDALAKLNDPSHDELRDMDLICSILEEIRASQELIVVVPDFDMDGVTSGTLGFAGLCELGFNAALYRPDYRLGHGVSPEAIEQVAIQFPEAAAVITCDVGITAHAGVDRAREMGLTVLVTDHHLETEGRVNAHAVIDPARTDETYANVGICGAHVLYQVLEAYARRHRNDKIQAIRLLRLFAGIGTVADVMPIVYENRELLRDSISIARLLMPRPDPEHPDMSFTDPAAVADATLLQILQAEDHHPIFVSAFEGMSVALGAFADIGKLRSVDDVDEGFYGFYLSPAFNAIRRIDGDLEDAFGVFFRSDRRECMERVIEGNEFRKQLVKDLLEELAESDQPHAPYVYRLDAPAGVLGLIANTLMQRSGEPTIVLSGLGGSARSPIWYPLNTTVNDAGFTAAGHEHACGVRVGADHQVPDLAALIEQSSSIRKKKLIDSGEMARMNAPDLRLGHTEDCDDELDDLDELLALAERIQTLRPFGNAFTEPVTEFVLDPALTSVTTLGSDQQHLRLTTHSGIKCLWWNQAERYEELQLDRSRARLGHDILWRVQGHLGVNTFRGMTSVNLFIDSLSPERPASHEPDKDSPDEA